jgi:type 1 glutamine amidotransferase
VTISVAPVGDLGRDPGFLVFVGDVSPYRHGEVGQAPAGVHRSLGSAAIAFEEVASLCGLRPRTVRHVGDLGVDELEQARALVLFTIGETPWTEEQKRVIVRRWVEGAMGVVGVHSATDSAYGWAEFGSLLGARFAGHPVTGRLAVHVVDSRHPATAHLPAVWHFRDELYLFRDLVDDARVLLAVPAAAAGPPDAAGMLPLCWCTEMGPARSFYTVLGHFLEAYEDGQYLQHLRGAVEWVMGGELPS